MGVAALDPATPHSGIWRQARQSALFRYYSRTGRGLSRNELSELVADAIKAAPSDNLHRYATAAEATRKPARMTGGRGGRTPRAAVVTWSHDKQARPGEFATAEESTIAYVEDLMRNRAVRLDVGGGGTRLRSCLWRIKYDARPSRLPAAVLSVSLPTSEPLIHPPSLGPTLRS